MTPARYQNCSLGYPQGEQKTESREKRDGAGLGLCRSPIPFVGRPGLFVCLWLASLFRHVCFCAGEGCESDYQQRPAAEQLGVTG